MMNLREILIVVVLLKFTFIQNGRSTPTTTTSHLNSNDSVTESSSTKQGEYQNTLNSDTVIHTDGSNSINIVNENVDGNKDVDENLTSNGNGIENTTTTTNAKGVDYTPITAATIGPAENTTTTSNAMGIDHTTITAATIGPGENTTSNAIGIDHTTITAATIGPGEKTTSNAIGIDHTTITAATIGPGKNTTSNAIGIDHTTITAATIGPGENTTSNAIGIDNTTITSATIGPGENTTSNDAIGNDHTTITAATNNTEILIQFGEIRLPQFVRPSFYEITMKPYIYEITEQPFEYDCKTVINITCYEDTYIIKLHSRLHEIINIRIHDVADNIDIKVDYYELNETTEMLGILLNEMLRVGKEYILEIDTVGVITDSLQGFYRSPYKVGNETRYIVTTMMEPTDARKVFPCFDEPDFKSVFLFYIYRKEWMTCLTNLPLRQSIGPTAFDLVDGEILLWKLKLHPFTSNREEDGFYLDIFDQPRNVPMSTYLVAIAIGDLGYIETYVRDVRFRTYSRLGAEHLTKFSLEIAVKTTEYFEDYFQIKYSLPKQDMIAVPTMSFNAMEHWGLITCRESSMFTEDGVSSTADKEWTAVLVAHEISHMWFGNIVSPKWWDELWLNEGFATYMMMLAVDKVVPEWEMMTKMPVDYRGTQNVFGVDDTLTSHPVYVEVENPSEIGEIFDLISYAKGSAVIRMMNFILGDETFRKGLTRFLTDYGFDTATHDDLWNSLSEQAIEDNNPVSNVKDIMDNWIKEMNYPVVTVAKLGESACLKQNAFLLSEEERKIRSHVFWDIPFTFSTDIDPSYEKGPEDIVWMRKDGNIVCFRNETMADAKWILGNIKQYGYFRVNYDRVNWEAILRQLSEDHEVFHPINRAQIINDAWHLAAAGLLDFDIALSTFDYLDNEVHFVPWKAAYRNIDFIRRALQLYPIYGDFQKYLRKKIEKAYFFSANPKTHNEKMRYTLLGYEACQYGLQACVDDAVERFNQWMYDDNVRVDPDMKGTVYCTGVKYGGPEAWEFVLNQYLTSDSPAERRYLVDALACTEQPWILAKLSNTALFSPGDYFLTTDKINVMGEMGTTPVGRMMAWNFLEQHWDLLFEKYGSELYLFPSLLKAITRSFNQPFELQRLERLAEAKQHNSDSGPRLFSSVLSKVKSNIRWIDSHYKQLEQWIKHRI